MEAYQADRDQLKQDNYHINPGVFDLVVQSKFQLVCELVKWALEKPKLLYIPNKDAKAVLKNKPDLLVIVEYKKLEYGCLKGNLTYASLKFDPRKQKMKFVSPLIKSSKDFFDIKSGDTGAILVLDNGLMGICNDPKQYLAGLIHNEELPTKNPFI